MKSGSKKNSKKDSKKCKNGQILRVGYTKKDGLIVKPGCIKATSQSGMKRSDADKEIIELKKKIHSQMREKYGSKKCKPGEILREGYKRKTRSNKLIEVPPECIKSRTGKPHGEQKFVLEKDVLAKYGYTDVKSLTKIERQQCLKKALKKLKPLSLMRRLNALSVLNKDQNPKLSKLFKDDSEWIKTTDEYKHRND